LLAQAFDGEEQADGHNLAGPKHRLAVVGDVFHAVVYPAEQISDKVFGGHGVGFGHKSVFNQSLTTLSKPHDSSNIN